MTGTHIHPSSSDLRERVLELEHMLMRETRQAQRNAALLAAAESLLAASNLREAFSAIYESLRSVLGVTDFVLVGNRSNPLLQRAKIHYEVLYSTVDGLPISFPCEMVRWFKKRRNVRDISEVPILAEFLNGRSGLSSLAALPFGTDHSDSGVLVCLHPETGFFGPEDLHLISRMAAYVARALRSIRIAERIEVLANVVEDSTSGLMLVEPYEAGGEIVFVNKAFERLSGFTVAGVPNRTFLSDRPSDSQERTDLREAFRNGRPGRFVVWNARPNGERFANEIHLQRIEDRDGRLRFMLATHADVTARVEDEAKQRLVKERLRDFERSESIGRIAAGVAHDFNNLLAVINGSAELFKANPEPARCIEVANRIGVASSRAAKMINRFLDLGSVDERFSTVDLGSILSESLDLLGTLRSPETRLTTDLGDRRLPVICNQTDILRVMLNLIQNAQDAIGNRPGEITQSLHRVSGASIPDGSIRVGAIDPALDYACYSVRDTGAGFAPEAADLVFKAVYTTKGASGSGLGLVAIAEVVTAHEGAIRLTSEQGKGTTVEILLPINEQCVVQSPTGEVGTIRLDGTLVLMVDDDPEISTVVGTFLENLGAEVCAVDDPVDALEAVRDDPDAWSILLTDYSMPGMNGARLAEETGRVAPDLPVVLITALARKIADPRLKAPQITALMSKPVDLSTLARTIHTHARKRVLA